MKASVYFESLGRSAYSRGLPLSHDRHLRQNLPMFARAAWARGWITQGSSKQKTETIVSGFERQAAAMGKTLQQTVDQFLGDMRQDDGQP